MFVTVCLCLIIGPLMNATLNETRMNEKNIVTMQAKNATESALEYGVSELMVRWSNQSNFPSDALITTPLTIPTAVSNLLWNGTAVNLTSIALTGGVIPNGQTIYIDPTNPANQFDPQRGKLVLARDVYVYGKASASTTYGGTQTAYAQEALEIRDGALFADAIFYNMDLELHPGPATNITGPIHCNGNLWAVCENGMTFSGPITASGNFNVGLIPWPTNWGSSSESAQTGKLVYIPNGVGGNTTPYRGSGTESLSSSYYDSRSATFSGNYTTWAGFATSRWGGNLLTGAMGVQTESVVGYNNFLAYNSTGNGSILDSDLNYAYAIIEPNQFNPATNPYHQESGEDQKFARQAGLITRVYPGPGNESGIIQSLAPGVTNTAAIVYKNNVAVFMFTGNSALPGNNSAIVNGNLDIAVGNFVNAANSASMNGNLTLITQNPIANATLPGPDPTNDPNGNLMDGNHFPMMLATQMQASTTSNNATAFVQGSYSNVMQWSSGSGNSTTTYRAVGFKWVTMSTLKTAVASNGLRTPVYNGSTALTDAYGDTTYQGDVEEQQIPVNAELIVGNYNGTGGLSQGTLQNMISFSPAMGNLSNLAGLTGSGNVSSGNLSYGGGSPPSTPTDSFNGFSYPPTPGNSTSTLWGGLYDGRRGMTVSTVSIDTQKLRQVLDDNTANFTTNSQNFFGNYTSANSTAYNPINNYNGVLYVDFPSNAPDASRLANVTVGNTTYPGDKMLTSQDDMGLVLMNATDQPNTFGSANPYYGVPDPKYNNPALSANATARNPGFTVATNNAMYIEGNYNADGNISTPASPYNPAVNGDNASFPDPPCALAADSITLLSGKWLNRTSVTDTSGSSGADTASNDEVCAGLVAGIVLSDSTSTSNESGGAQNFPRFLENWGSATLAYRGSLVCLYSSEIGAQPWASGYYSPPTRNWGYYSQFASGNYPPGTPASRSYRLVNFSFLNQAQYNAALAALPTH